jgi:DNA-binding winged helix-turn-helix (wHTH) protein
MRLRFGDVEFDAERRRVRRLSVEIHLSVKAFELLKLLLERRPNAVSKSEIQRRLWGDTFVSQTNLPTLVAEIRTAIDDDAKQPHFIKTLHGFGYAFEGDVVDAAGRPLTREAAARLIRPGGDLALFAGENVIGREGADVVVDSPTVSRRHARIVIGAGDATIDDLGSKNGTYVNDARVDRASALRDGDAVRIGALTFTFRATPEGASTETVGVS